MLQELPELKHIVLLFLELQQAAYSTFSLNYKDKI